MKNRQRRTAYRTGASVSALVLAMALASPAEATCSFGVQTKTCDATTTTDTSGTGATDRNTDFDTTAGAVMLNVTGPVTGFGLSITDIGGGAMAVTNNGSVQVDSGSPVAGGSDTALFISGVNGTYSYTGAGDIHHLGTGAGLGVVITGTGSFDADIGGSIDAANGSAIAVASTGAAGGAIDITTLASETIKSSAFGISVSMSGTGATTITNAASISSSGPSGSLVTGITVGTGATGTGSISITNSGAIGTSSDRAQNNGIYASVGNATSNGSTTINGTGAIYSQGAGIDVQAYGTGLVDLQYSGSIDASNGDAIYVLSNDAGGGDITVNTVAGQTLKSSAGNGIEIQASGTGSVTVTNNAAISSSSTTAGPLTHGIDVYTAGTGGLIVQNNGAIGSQTDRATLGGISAIFDTAGSAADIDVTGSGAIFSGSDGIHADNFGTGAVAINYSGTIDASAGHGIEAYTTDGAETITVGANVTVSGTGYAGVKGTSETGPITVNVTGGSVVSTGGVGPGIYLTSGSDLPSGGPMIVNVAAGRTVSGTAAILTEGSGTLTVNNLGTITGVGGNTAVDTSLSNQTTINNLAGGVINGRVDLSDFADTVANSGTWNVSATNNFNLGTDLVTNNAGGVINTPSAAVGAIFDGLETLANAGRINVNGVLGFTGVATSLTNSGRIDFNGASVTTGLGTLTNDGVINMNGTSKVSAATFTQAPTASIVFALAPTALGTQPVASYPQLLVSGTATLAGTLTANITTAGTLLGSMFWDNVIDAATRTGTFTTCGASLNGAAVGSSLLLDFSCLYDTAGNVDLALTRSAFSVVPGLNQNGTSVAEGLDCLDENGELTGGILDVVGDLVIIADPDDYNQALNMLAGEGYANYLQSFPSLGVRYDDIADKATSCEIPALAGSVLECRNTDAVHLWGQVDHKWRRAGGDIEAGATNAKGVTGVLGFDARLGQSGLIGAMAGAVDNDTIEHRFGQDVEGEGYVFGAYGVYDPGAFYVKAIGTYSVFDGNGDRRVDFSPYGGTFSARIGGDPDVNMWTLGLHGGARFATGKESVLTPYLDVDYVNAKLDQFVERNTGGDEGAELNVLGGTSKHTFLTGGAKWAFRSGGMVPEINLGYRYRFGDRRAKFSACFDDNIDCSFDIISAAEKRGSLLAGINVGGKLGVVDVRASYEGEFNSSVTSHNANLRLVLPLGAGKH